MRGAMEHRDDLHTYVHGITTYLQDAMQLQYIGIGISGYH